MGGYPVSPRAAPAFQDVIGTRFLLCITLAVIGTAAVTTHQFLTRRTTRSIGIIAGTAGLIVLTGAFWPWSLNLDDKFYSYVIRRAEGEWPASAEPPGLTFAPASAEFVARRDRPDRPGIFKPKYRVDGLAEGQGLMPVLAEHTWRWPGGAEEKGRTWGLSPLHETMAARVLGPAVADTPRNPGPIVFNCAVKASTMAKIRGEPAAYSLAARFRLMKFVSADVLPAQPGKWVRSGASGERIANVEKEGPELHVTYIAYRPALWIDNLGGGQLAPPGDYSTYYLVNRATKFVDRGGTSDMKSTRIGTVLILWRTTTYTAVPPRDRTVSAIAAINALNEAELVKVTFAEQARFSHELTLSAAEVAKANP
jgi:hypothetical protein